MDYKHSYDQFDFVNNGEIMDMFICKICHSVSKDPYETKCCSTTFYKSCIDTAKQQSTTCCPWCRKQPYQIMQAVQINRQIQILPVYCKNRNQGCTWVGALEQVNIHLRECLLKTVKCEYHIVGCNAMVTQDFQMQHNINEMKKHFSMVAKYVEDKLKLNNSTKQQLINSKQELQDTRRQLVYSERKVKNIQQELNESNRKVNSIMKELEDTKKEVDDAKKEVEDTKKEVEDTKVKLANSDEIVTFYIVISFMVVVLIFSLMIKGFLVYI